MNKRILSLVAAVLMLLNAASAMAASYQTLEYGDKGSDVKQMTDFDQLGFLLLLLLREQFPTTIIASILAEVWTVSKSCVNELEKIYK